MKFLILLSCVVYVHSCGMPGSYCAIDANSPEVQKMSEFAVTEYANTNGLTAGDLTTTVKHVETQVVAGLNYKMTVEINNAGSKTLCHFVVYSKWDGTKQLTSTQCSAEKNSRVFGVLAGGQEHVDPNDKDLLAAMNFAVTELNKQSNSLYKMMLISPTHCTQQVVSGMRYDCTIIMGESDCTTYQTDLSACSLKAGGMHTTMKVSVWSQPWMNPKYQLLSSSLVSDMPTEGPKNSMRPGIIIKDKVNSLLGKDWQKKVGSVLDEHLLKKLENGVIRDGAKQKMAKLLGNNVLDLKKQDAKKIVDSFVELGKQPQVEHILGRGWKSLKQNGKLQGDIRNLLDERWQNKVNSGLQDFGTNLLGGDGHDMVLHGNKKNLLGGDGHDMIPHGNKRNLLGGDGHDLVPHGNNKNLGGDGHDMVPHGNNKNLGGDGHDLVPHGNNKNLGGDGHDLCHYGMFMDFKKKHGRLYSSTGEEKKRFKVFCDNMAKARTLQKHEMGTAIYGATQFADLTESEFKQYVGKPWDLNANVGMEKAKIPQGNIPTSFDWRNHNAVTPVKNQGTCGSCWAFSTTGNLEGQYSIKHGKLISLSEQELVDCDKVDEGCNGGLPSNAYKEIIRLGGLESESDYKYVGHNEKCLLNKTECKVTVNKSLSISSDEKEMASWLVKNGPISIGINAFAMQFYMGGISHPWKIFCNPKSLDHGVLIVGYGEDDKKTPYWIVKNSWGPSWGEKGYYLVYRGDGVCGLNTMCTSGIVN